MSQLFYICIPIALAIFIFYLNNRKSKILSHPSRINSKSILEKHVQFYQKLSKEEKVEFENRVSSFLDKVKITGIETKVEDMDRIFVASGAIIPIFAFKNWEYQNINEVLIYPNSFDQKFNTKGKGRNVVGMVGEGGLQNTMILAKQNLRNGFLDIHSKSNTAIHEFVHLVDKEDGYIDGFPHILISEKQFLPWLIFIHEEIQLIKKGKSDINAYAATNDAEFLAVASEYFFKQPHLLQKKHPELHKLLEEIFSPMEMK